MPDESFRPEDDYAPLSDYQRHMLHKFCRNMGEWPAEFWAGLKSKLEVDPPNLLVSDIPSLKGEQWREIGATGQPGFANSWVNYDGGFDTAGFYKDALGIVHIKGLIKNGTSGAAAFTLPEGYRPALRWIFGTDGSSGHGRLDVTAAGEVIPSTATSTHFSITCHFRAA